MRFLLVSCALVGLTHLYAATAPAISPELLKQGKSYPANVPPLIDKALRRRVIQFYDCQVAGKFRQAQAYIANDSQDAYYEAGKIRYDGYELVAFQYAPGFKKADVIVAVKTRLASARFNDMPVMPPIHTLWKIENGRWCWYVVPNAPIETPFGPAPNPGSVAPGTPAPVIKPTDLSQVLTGVQADKKSVDLTPGISEQDVLITNHLGGWVTISLYIPAKVPGFEAKLDKTQLKVHESAHLHLTRGEGVPTNIPAITLTVDVDPTNQSVPVEVILNKKPPAEQ